VINDYWAQSRNETIPRALDWIYNASNATVPAIVVGPQVAAAMRAAVTIERLELKGTLVENAHSRNVIGVTTMQVLLPGSEVGTETGTEAASEAGAAAFVNGGEPVSTIVVTTPFNGFYKCGGERGPGIAMLLDIARRAVGMTARHHGPYIARATSDVGVGAAPAGSVANVRLIVGFLSGHELGSLGLQAFLETLSTGMDLGPSDVAAFFSLGANIAMYGEFEGDNFGGAGSGAITTSASASPDLYELASAAMPKFTTGVVNCSAAAGDTRFICAAGYQTLALLGATNYRFHLETDAADSTNETMLRVAADQAWGAVAAVAEAAAAAAAGGDAANSPG